jgi:predicted Zn-dependent peptidase
MRKFKLKNGLTVIWEPRKSDSVAIEVCIGTGSNNEKSSFAGMSHFLEHMIFEGTSTRSTKQISEAIENVGGELNAATSNERTFFYVKIPKSKLDLGLDILSDMVKNPALDPKIMEKERRVVLEEIKMVNDQPIMYQWVLFEKSLFKKHPTRNPVYGRVESVKSITRNQMLNYYKKWYVPGNITLCVVGDTRNSRDMRRKIEKRFGDMKPKKKPKIPKVIEPQDKKPTIKREKRDTKQAYFVLGYKTVPRTHKDSFALDVISAIFSKGLSGRINEEIRVKRGLAYSVGTNHDAKNDYGFFIFYLNCAKKNLGLCKSIMLDEVDKLSNLTSKEIGEAKDHIIGRVLLDKENSQRRADELAFWEFIKDARLSDTYVPNIRKVTKKDIIRVRNKFFHDNYTMVVISK